MPQRIGLFLVLLALVAPALAADTLVTTGEAYLDHVKFLASDELKGRQPGTPGIEKAAEYIAQQFEKAGLAPGGANKSWYQEFSVARGKKLDESAAKLAISGLDVPTQVGKDWTPLPFTEMNDVEAPLAFAGYGIKAEEFSYNDYADFDPNGKVLLIFRYEPQSDDPKSEFGGKEASHFAEFRSKARTAARRGAKALLIVNPPKREDAPVGLYKFTEEMSRQTFDIPVAQITPEFADAILKKAGADNLETLQEKLDKERTPLSRDLGLDVTLKPGVSPNLIKTRNVIGLLKGKDGVDETIVIGAHYDHLGDVPRQFDRENDDPFVHNGADDNASGTAAVIELARTLAKTGGLRRNVLFIAFSAEEMGLYGSAQWVAEPTLPLSSVRAMINFDMIGRLSQDRFTIFGVPSAAEFEPLMKAAADSRGLTFHAPKGLMGNSDHGPFLNNEIPYLFAFTGMHKQYHRPEDDADLIDGDGGAKIVDLFHEVVTKLANMESGPVFTPAKDEAENGEDLPRPAFEEAEKQRERGASQRPSGDREAGTPGMPRARLGIIPEYTNDGAPGVVVQGTVDGGPAKAAGIKDNDRIVRINDSPVKDIYGYMAAMKELKPGEEVAVTVVREGKEQTIKVKLQKPRRDTGRE